MSESRGTSVLSNSGRARRMLRTAGIAILALLLVLAGVRFGAIRWIERVEREAEAEGVLVRDDKQRPARLPEAHAALVARLARAPMPTPSASGAGAEVIVTGAQQPPADVATSIDAELCELEECRWDAPFVAYTAALRAAADDSASVPSPEMRAWLAAHDAAITRVQEAVLTWESEELQQALGAPWQGKFWVGRIAMPSRMWRAAWVGQAIGARAAIAATDGAQAEADRACQALLRLQAIDSDDSAAVGLIRFVWYLGILRRVRPANAREWIALMDGTLDKQGLAGAANGAFHPPPHGPYRVGWRYPTLNGLHERLPHPARQAVDALLLAPAARMRWARETNRVLAARAASMGAPDCISRVPAPGEWHPSWALHWTNAVVHQSDVLLTREVLRLTLGDDGIELTASPCADWWLEVDPLPDGSVRVRVEGPVREAPRGGDAMPPPLDYTLPAMQ